MCKFRNNLKTVILFLFFLFGCSHKYVDVKGRSLDKKIVTSWKELDADTARRYDEEILLNVQVKDFVEVRDSMKAREVYRSVFGGRDVYAKKNYFGTSEILTGCAIAGGATLAAFYAAYGEMVDPAGGRGYSLATCYGVVGGVGALCFILRGFSKSGKTVKLEPYSIHINRVCVDSTVISIDKVNILIEDKNFRKEYFTDEDGNIELKMNEIIPDPTEADSILNLIIQYESMVDSVKVRRL